MPHERLHLAAWDQEYRSHKAMWRGPADIDDLVGHIPPGATVLELGCGNGKTLRALEEKGFRVVGQDASLDGLRLAKEHTKVSLILSDACHLPFKTRFDTVVAHHLLEHLTGDERRQAIEEIKRVLAPAGLLFIKAFSKKDMRAGKGERTSGIRYHYFDEEEVGRLLEGFEILELNEETKEARYGTRAWVRAVGKKS